MRVLVLGANGLLGSNVVKTAQMRGHDVAGTYHTSNPAFDVPLKSADIRDTDRIREILSEYSPDVAVNCAALTDVDGCEADLDKAFAINANAPGEIAAVCSEMDIKFVQVSTDYVFDGSIDEPYSETDDPNPIQVYGESKLAGEQAVRGTTAETYIVRLSFLYGIHRANNTLSGFPEWVRDRLDKNESTPLFVDQYVTPTRAGQAAATILEVINRENSGTVHVACRSCVTPYMFGELICQRMNAEPDLLVESSMSDVEREAKRPTYTCFEVNRVESFLGRPQPSLEGDISLIESAFV